MATSPWNPDFALLASAHAVVVGAAATHRSVDVAGVAICVAQASFAAQAHMSYVFPGIVLCGVSIGWSVSWLTLRGWSSANAELRHSGPLLGRARRGIVVLGLLAGLFLGRFRWFYAIAVAFVRVRRSSALAAAAVICSLLAVHAVVLPPSSPIRRPSSRPNARQRSRN